MMKIATLAGILMLGASVASAADLYGSLNAGTAFNGNASYDNASVMGAAVGADFGWFRSELAYTHYEGSRTGSAFGDLDSKVLTVRGIFEQDFGRWTPYAGLGLGVGFLNGSATRDDNVFVGEALTGVRYRFNEVWSGSFGYTYTRSFNADAVRKTVTATDDLQYHVITVGATYKF